MVLPEVAAFLTTLENRLREVGHNSHKVCLRFLEELELERLEREPLEPLEALNRLWMKP